jgi:prepilin-type N-terminal cleavage/methylation domain-containing protein
MEHRPSEVPVVTAQTQRARPTAGFTLIEVLVSITILAVGILALGTLMGRGARTATAASATSQLTTIMGAEAARYDAIPFTQLAAGTNCDTQTAGPLPRVRCVTVTIINPKLRRVTLIVTPTGNPLVRPDTLIFERSISGSAVPPLSTP